jgi:glutamate-1-semialdehyde 2,1-aminomutase
LELNLKIVAIVQARMGSTRLPNKVMKPMGGVPMIEVLLARLARAGEIDEVMVATSVDACNQVLFDHVAALGFKCYRGSEDDVLDRYVQAARLANADVVVRITGDCPLVDPALVDEAVRLFKTSQADYLSNVSPPTFPDGLDIEVFTAQALEKAARETALPFDREHVTPYLRTNGQYRQADLQHDEDLSGLRWTVDESADYEVMSRVFAHFSPDIHFGWPQVLQLQRSRPEIFHINKNLHSQRRIDYGYGPKTLETRQTSHTRREHAALEAG